MQRSEIEMEETHTEQADEKPYSMMNHVRRTISVRSYHSEDWYDTEDSVSLERKTSVAADLTHAVIHGRHPHRHTSGVYLYEQSDFEPQESAEDIFIENLLAQGKKRPPPKENIRAAMGFWKLIWFDFKHWYRRWKVKHGESMILKGYIKYMESNFGSAIGSFFVFTRWIMMLNFVMAVLWIGFVVLPVAIIFEYTNVTGHFAVIHLIDGEGMMTRSWFFYGSYDPDIVKDYSISLAYLLMLILTYFGSLYIIFESILIGGGCTAIVYVVLFMRFEHIISDQETVDDNEEESSDFLSVYGSIVIFMVINSTVPVCIQLLPKFEHYATGKHELNVTLTRIFFLRMANLFALISSLYNTVTKNVEGCAGTIIGQEMYKLVITDTVLHSFFELVYKFLSYYWTKQKTEFNMSSAVLVLVYRQALIWVGTLACPVLPLIGTLSNMVFFSVNYIIVSKTCKPPIKRWNQSRNTSFFAVFLLASLGLLIPPASLIIGSSEFISLGQTEVEGHFCGPFGSEKPTRAYTDFALKQPDWLQWILQRVVSEPVLIPVFLILITVLKHQYSKLSNEKKHSTLLQAELQEEREENEKLIKKLQSMGIAIDKHYSKY